MSIKELLGEIKKRHEATTPGEWILMPELCGPQGQGVYQLESGGQICEVGDPYPRGDNCPQENMEFIVAAHNTDVPALIAEVELLLKRRDSCLFCEHFIFVPKIDGYSDMTPGQNMNIDCRYSVWNIDDCDSEAEFQKMMESSVTCEWFCEREP